MDESIICECGNSQFWYFGSFVRCSKCFIEIKQEEAKNKVETWLRRFNKETNSYEKNWEKISHDGNILSKEHLNEIKNGKTKNKRTR